MNVDTTGFVRPTGWECPACKGTFVVEFRDAPPKACTLCGYEQKVAKPKKKRRMRVKKKR